MSVQEVNKLLKMHRQMSDMMKKMGKGGMAGLMQQMGGMPGGMPNSTGINKGLPAADNLQFEELKKQLTNIPRNNSGLPGLGGGKPRLPGIGGLPFGNKKK